MRISTIASLATVGTAFAAPQSKDAEADAKNEWADYDYIAANIETILPEVLPLALPGTDAYLSVYPLITDLAHGKGVARIIKEVVNKGAGKVPDPVGAASRFVTVPSRNKVIKDSTTVKVRYGPYNIPSVKVTNVLGESGTLFNFPDVNVKKPCEGDCMVLGLSAGLEYPDGRNANINNGLWLHHMVLLAEGPGRWDPTCGDNPKSLPHMLVGASSNNTERIFSSGNERTAAITGDWGLPNAGIKLVKEDKFHMIVDLMNTNDKDEVAYLTFTYDIVQGHPAGIDNIKVVWFDIAQCGASEVLPLAQTGKWELTSKPWYPTFEGEIIAAAGHLHDGGTDIQIVVDGKVACDSAASYGTKPEFIGKGMGGGHHAGATPHISEMSLCIIDKNLDHVKYLKKNQKWDLKALYDYEKYPGMSHGDGKQSNVMGIAIMFVRQK